MPVETSRHRHMLKASRLFERTKRQGLDGLPERLERDVVSDGCLATTSDLSVPTMPPAVAFHDNLLPRSVFLRFFTFHTESPQGSRAPTCVDYVNRLALVAEIEDRLIAVGRYDSAPKNTEAEVAFVVADDFQHHGIGALLLDELVPRSPGAGYHLTSVRKLSVRIARCWTCPSPGSHRFDGRVRNGDASLSHRTIRRLQSGARRP